jgi:hypothetical protein
MTRDSGLIGYGALSIVAFAAEAVSQKNESTVDERHPMVVQLCRGLPSPRPDLFSHELKNLLGSNTSFLLSMK